MILDFPRLKCYVDATYVSDGEQSGFIEAYVFAITLLESRPLLFTVHTIDGAVYSRLPIQALRTQPIHAAPIAYQDPWGAISSDGCIIQHAYLKDYHVEVTLNNKKYSGLYWATIDYNSGGFAQDPEQHKTSNIVLLDSGLIVAAPNNFCLFKDLHFTNKTVSNTYRRNRKYWTLP